ncbi:efflux transporter outer membrane subunit [Shewanella sp.]|uniref:efflux transporter outer membrane subunit n=1 Tax=Shewanella sp. TaxID=50422 RepID=UPI003A978CDE
MIKRPLAMLTVALLSGCVVGPDYQAPDLQMPEQYSTSLQQDHKARSVKDWQAFYLNPQLQKLIEHALSNNLSLATMQSRLRAAKASLTVTNADRWPEVNGVVGAERTKDSGLTNSGGLYDSTRTLGVEASWELDIWGAQRRADQGQWANTLSSAELLLAAKVSLISEVAAAYYELADIEKRLQISQETAELRAKELTIARLRHQNGVISGLDVRQVQVEYQTAMVNLPQLKYERQQKSNQLRILLGEYSYDIDTVSLDIDKQFPESLVAGIPSRLLEQRPDLRASEQALIAATADVGVAQAAKLPSFTITGAYGRESESLDDILKARSVAWSLAGGVTAPIFNAGKLDAELTIAQETRQQALLAYRSAVLNAYTEVKDGMNDYQRAQQVWIEQRRLLDASSAYLRLAQLRYKNGVATSLDLIDAQRNHFTAELELSEAQRDRQLAMITLYRALGGGVGQQTAIDLVQANDADSSNNMVSSNAAN